LKNLDPDSLYAILPETAGPERLECLNLLADVLTFKDTDTSIFFAGEAINLARQLGDKKGEAYGHFNLGRCHFIRYERQEHVRNYLTADRLFDEAEPCREHVNLCFQMMIMYYKYNRHRNVVECGKKAATLSEQLDYQNGIIGGYVSMCSGYLQMDMIDSAWYCNEIAYEKSNETTRPDVRSHILNEFGRMSGAKADDTGDTTFLREGINWFLKGLEIPGISTSQKRMLTYNVGAYYNALGGEKNIAIGNAYLARVEGYKSKKREKYPGDPWGSSTTAWRKYDQGDLDSTIFYFEKALYKAANHPTNIPIEEGDDIIDLYSWQTDWLVYERNAHYGLYLVYNDRGNYKKAMEEYVLYDEVDEKLKDNKTQEMLDMLEAESESLKIKNRMALLARDLDMKNLKINQSRIMNYGFAGIFIILLLLGFLSYRQHKLKNENRTVQLEQKLLRLQINPHFIFNALSNILNFIDGKENNKASDYLTKFSKLLRTTLESTREDMVSFDKEADSLKYYLELQKLRYGNKFDYRIDIDEKIDPEEISIPPMLVQPFIENAIEHGIRHKNTPGRIDVRFTMNGEKIVCEVEDDGVGRAQSWEMERKERQGHKSLATEIIRDRILNLNKKLKHKIQLEGIDKIADGTQVAGTKVVLDMPFGNVYD
jgi:hypothetical protein